jgi:hypothetical protein
MVTHADYLQQDRVRRHTGANAQRRIDEATRQNIRHFAHQPPALINDRIAQLDREPDMEQVLEFNASVLALTGAVLGTTVDKRFFLLTGVVLSFLTQHALTGWCPPVPVFRRFGVRTRTEIDQEKHALKALRGDYHSVARSAWAKLSSEALLRCSTD